jgi:hypothetical protein
MRPDSGPATLLTVLAAGNASLQGAGPGGRLSYVKM